MLGGSFAHNELIHNRGNRYMGNKYWNLCNYFSYLEYSTLAVTMTLGPNSQGMTVGSIRMFFESTRN